MSSQPNSVKTCVIFPAFVPEYSGIEQQAISGHEDEFARKLYIASEALNLDLTGFDFVSNNFIDDEEKAQYISYIFSCTVADILKKGGLLPGYVSAYSMGIYAALYYCGSVSFQVGLQMVRAAWESISRSTAEGDYGMGMIVGLSEEDIDNIIGKHNRVWICNRNNPHTYIISGERKGIDHVLTLAHEEGALRSNILPVSKPYHTSILGDAILDFSRLLDELALLDPAYPYISSLDQQEIISAGGLRQELIRNLYHRMNWYDTMKKLIDLGTGIFFECGAGDGLTRNFRFIDGKVKAYSIDSLELFISHGEH
jgi:[acyl-carrier-protein] S-malonyltransferase